MKKTTVVSILLVIALLIIAGLVLAEKISVKLPIDTPEKAIAYVKTIGEVKRVVIRWRMKGWETEFFPHFDDAEQIWVVSLVPKGTIDLFFEVKLKADGTIISKGYGEGG